MDIKQFVAKGDFTEFGTLHVIKNFNESSAKIGELWFSGNEVATILGYKNIRDALSKHVHESDKMILSKKSFCESQNATHKNTAILQLLWTSNKDHNDKTIINEAGLYSLIFGSKLASAVKFKYWVTHDVLPSIRQNGGYIMDQEKMPDDIQAQINDVTQKLADKIARVTRQYNSAKRLHKKAVAQRDGIKGENKHLKKEIKCWKSEVNDIEAQYMKALADLDYTQNRLKSLRNQLTAAESIAQEAKSYSTSSKYMVDAYGFIV